MKITDYPEIWTLHGDHVFITDTSTGTKKIKASSLMTALFEATPEMHNAIYRGKSLGASITADQRARIANGSFTNLWLGDYWTINGIKWRIAAFDYFASYGTSTPNTKPHILVIPDTIISTNVVYHKDPIRNAYQKYASIFSQTLKTLGSSLSNTMGVNLLHFNDVFISIGSDGYPNSWELVDSTIHLPSQGQLFGATRISAVVSGTAGAYTETCRSRQLPLFAVAPKFIGANGSSGYWLHDIYGSLSGLVVGPDGIAVGKAINQSFGVRPILPIAG